MKKLVLLLLFLFIAPVFADYGPTMQNIITSKDNCIHDLTLANNNQVYSITLSEGSIVQYMVQAVGGTVRNCINGTTTEAYWDIPSGAVAWNQLPENLPVNTVLYFWTPTSAPCTVEVMTNYR